VRRASVVTAGRVPGSIVSSLYRRRRPAAVHRSAPRWTVSSGVEPLAACALRPRCRVHAGRACRARVDRARGERPDRERLARCARGPAGACRTLSSRAGLAWLAAGAQEPTLSSAVTSTNSMRGRIPDPFLWSSDTKPSAHRSGAGHGRPRSPIAPTPARATALRTLEGGTAATYQAWMSTSASIAEILRMGDGLQAARARPFYARSRRGPPAGSGGCCTVVQPGGRPLVRRRALRRARRAARWPPTDGGCDCAAGGARAGSARPRSRPARRR